VETAASDLCPCGVPKFGARSEKSMKGVSG